MIMRKDLTDIGDKDYHQRQGEYLLCECGESFGGTRGDYFNMTYDTNFTCRQCGSNNISLVKNVQTIEIIKC